MKQATITKIIDLLSFIVLTLMVSTGVFLRFTLPPRSGGDQVWNLSRHAWGDIHYYFAVAFLFLMVTHLFSHAKFIKSVFMGKASTEKNYRIAIGIMGVIVLIMLAFSPVISPVTELERGQHNYHQKR